MEGLTAREGLFGALVSALVSFLPLADSILLSCCGLATCLGILFAMRKPWQTPLGRWIMSAVLFSALFELVERRVPLTERIIWRSGLFFVAAMTGVDNRGNMAAPQPPPPMSDDLIMAVANLDDLIRSCAAIEHQDVRQPLITAANAMGHRVYDILRPMSRSRIAVHNDCWELHETTQRFWDRAQTRAAAARRACIVLLGIWARERMLAKDVRTLLVRDYIWHHRFTY